MYEVFFFSLLLHHGEPGFPSLPLLSPTNNAEDEELATYLLVMNSPVMPSQPLRSFASSLQSFNQSFNHRLVRFSGSVGHIQDVSRRSVFFERAVSVQFYSWYGASAPHVEVLKPQPLF